MNPIDFPVAGLVVGETYTYRISGGSNEVDATYGPDPFHNTEYRGGTAIINGAFAPDFDLDFIIVGETPAAAAIPAPATIALLGAALAGLALIRARASVPPARA